MIPLSLSPKIPFIIAIYPISYTLTIKYIKIERMQKQLDAVDDTSLGKNGK